MKHLNILVRNNLIIVSTISIILSPCQLVSPLISPLLSFPLDSAHHVGGVLEGLSPNHEELEDYDYEENEEEAVMEEASYLLPLTDADKKMQSILDKLPMITTKKPKR